MFKNFIFDLQRFKDISNTDSNILISGTSKADFISNSAEAEYDEYVHYYYYKGSNVTIDAGKGNDRIENYGASNVSILGGAGNDAIYNESVTVEFDEELYNKLYEIYEEAKAEFERFGGGYFGEPPEPFGEVTPDEATLSGGDGNDYIYNEGEYGIIDGGKGNDTISNSGNNVLIDGGAGNDSISNSGERVDINGGAGNDYIDNSGANISISGGTGNDTISLGYENLIQYADGDGKDTILGFNADDTLSISGGTYSTQASGDDVLVKVGEGTTTLKDTYLTNGTININGETIKLEKNITLTDGDDTISNSRDNSNIDGGAGNDYIDNSGSNVSINGGKGNDTISLGYANLIQYKSGDGKDTILDFNADDTLSISSDTYSTQESGFDVLVKVGKGTITLKDARLTTETININGETIYLEKIFNLTKGNDSFENRFDDATINALGGNDTIYNFVGAGGWGSSSISGGDGDDYIYNEGDCSTIDGGAGNDYFENRSDYATINALGGNDTIYNFGGAGGWGSSISGGDGDDYIYNEGEGSIIDGGKGNDTIDNNDYYVDIDGGSGNDSISNSGSNVSISGGTGNDSISNSGSNVSILGGKGNDTISLGSYAANNLIQYKSGDGNDLIEGFNADDSLSISGGTYSTQMSGDDVLVKVGKGTITLKDVYVTTGTININGETIILERNIKLTDGNDTISNSRSYSNLDGGAGNDEISNSGSNVSILGGKGNDTINLDSYAANNLIQYKSGDGKDLIEGFNEDDTLSISGGTYSTQESGFDVLVKVGKGTITLKDARTTLETININGETIILERNIKLTDGNDTISNSRSYSNLDGGAGNDEISNSGSNVSILGGKGNDTINLDSYAANNLIQYKSGDGNDLIEGFNADDTLSISGGKYSTQESGDDVLVKVGKGTITLKDVYLNTGTININGETIKLEKNITLTEGNDSFENRFDNATINALGGKDTISNYRVNVSIEGGAGNDTIINYEGGDNSILDGGAGNDSISNGSNWDWNDGGNNVTIEGGAGKDTIGNTGSNASINGGAGNDTIINYEGGDNSILNGGDGNDVINNHANGVTISGGAGDDTIYNLERVLAYEVCEIIDYDEDEEVCYYVYETVTPDYITINSGAGNDLISNKGSNVLFQYTEGDGNDTILGFNSTSTLKIGGGKGFYSTQKSGSDIIVTVGEGKITLDGAASLSKVNIAGTEASWQLDGTTAIYNTSKKTLVTVTGVKSLSGISLSGTTVTVSKASLNKENVTISKGYTLALGSDVTKSSATKAWSLKSSTASYKQTTTAGYTLADNAITYNKKSVETLATVKGVKSLDGLSLKSKTVTLSKASLGTSNVTISDGYKLKLGSDVTKPSATKAWTLKDTTASYTQTTTAGYTLADNAITYNKKSVETLATVKGVKSLDGLSLKSKTVTLSKASLGTSKVTISDGYKLALGSDVTKPSTTKAWTLKDTTASYTQTTTAGYTLADNAITYNKKSVETLATVKGVKSLDGLSLKSKTVTLSKASLGTSNVTISDGYKLKLGDDVTKPSATKAWTLKDTTASYTQTTTAGYTLADNAITYNKKSATTLATVKGVTSTEGLSVSGQKITLKNSALSNKVTVSGGYEFNFASDYNNATITGSSNTDTITARGSKISVNGGKGDDTVKMLGTVTVMGGKGSDVFVYSSGKNVIYDYAEDDKISIGASISATTLNGSDVVFTVGKGSLTVKDAKGKTLNLIDAEGNEYPTVLGSTTLTLTNISASPVTVDSSIKVIDASTRTTDINITGNELNNSIFGGSGNDYLYGGKGKDSLSGGDGNDIISGDADNDKLYGGGGNDSINGGDGNDRMSGGEGDDILLGGKGNDFLYGDADNDALYGNAGDDTLRGAGGNDSLWGGAGADLFIHKPHYEISNIMDYSYTDGDILQILNADGTNVDYSKAKFADRKLTLTIGDGSVIFNNVTVGDKININGTTKTINGNTLALGGTTLTVTNAAASSLKVDSSIKVIDASTRTTDINITGNELNNSIFGGSGNDYLYGGKGKDSLSGGDGNDIISGDADNDKLYGGGGNDSINGGDGNDRMSGDAGNDTILGGKGNDYLYGGEGNDFLYGNAGDDTLRGAGGNDSLWGGAGADLFIHKPHYEISNIMDYSYTDGDILQILNADGTNADYSKAEFADNKLTLTVGDSSVIFNNVTVGDKININGTTKTINGKTLK